MVLSILSKVWSTVPWPQPQAWALPPFTVSDFRVWSYVLLAALSLCLGGEHAPGGHGCFPVDDLSRGGEDTSGGPALKNELTLPCWLSVSGSEFMPSLCYCLDATMHALGLFGRFPGLRGGTAQARASRFRWEEPFPLLSE